MTYWLIERNQKHGQANAVWLSKDGMWVNDASLAERFASKQEAEEAIGSKIFWWGSPEATEHMDV